MRVNIIGTHKKNTGVSQDAHILHGMLAHVLGEELQVRHIPYFHPQCAQAEVNIFIEVINPVLFPYASKNIWIPNPEWTYKTHQPYAHLVDEIWAKTHEAERIFAEWVPTTKIRYIGWTSIDKVMPERKNFHKAIVPVGKNIWRNPFPLIQAYTRIQQTNPVLFRSLPELHIVHQPEAVPIAPIPPALESKVILHSELLGETAYDALLHECGLCICLSAAEGFGHAVNEAMSAGCILMLSPIDAFQELTNDALWVSELKRTPHTHCLATLYDVDAKSIVDTMDYYDDMSFPQRKEVSAKMRTLYEDRHRTFIATLSSAITELFHELPVYSLESRLPKEEDLPKVSVITITRDRRPFIPLAKYGFLAQAYPEDKLEWVVVDDGKDQIKDMISDIPNLKYVLVDEPMTIGAKRNLAVQSASHDILVMMDDDDVYPNNSIVARVAHMLAEPRRECLFSTTIPCYQIHDKKSFMNVPPMTLPWAERVSEATLCFTRAFWEAGKFPDQQIAEGCAFVRGREQKCRELSPQDVIVSLIHKQNTSSRKPPPMEPNGCHYGFSEDLFTLVTEIGESL
jgi:hypothetical protein